MHKDDEEEFREFVTSRMESLRGLAYLTCGDWQLAEDAVSTVLAKLYTRWSRVVMLYSYARRMVVNAAIDETRRPWRRERSTSPELLDGPTPGEQGRADELTHVRDALREVPPGQRAVLVLRFYEGLSVDETAEVLGRRRGTVKSQTAKGLGALRTALSADQLEVTIR
ncbi:SigE family RNA polymerase sigma factor [Micromonospora sp. CA-246542]|uniref:SigE family RNA polymerase sigma factor n=1 Tax=Micromonospora sp. CA-246542 TaxID=3239959 RepID=UPI003D9169CE